MTREDSIKLVKANTIESDEWGKYSRAELIKLVNKLHDYIDKISK